MAIYKNNNSEKKGKVTYNSGILKGIVALAVSEVSGVSLKKGKKDKLNLLKITFVEELDNGIIVNVNFIQIPIAVQCRDIGINIQGGDGKRFDVFEGR